MSLDVVWIVLFTNVPIDYAMDCIKDHWRFISRDCCLPEEKFKAIQFVLDSTFFGFDSVIYRQNYETPMGSPLFPIIADLVMRKLEVKALSAIRFPLLFYYRFVNDILLVAPAWLVLFLIFLISNILGNWHYKNSQVLYHSRYIIHTVYKVYITEIKNNFS